MKRAVIEFYEVDFASVVSGSLIYRTLFPLSSNDPQLSENPGTRTKREYSLAEIYHAEQQLCTGLEPKIIGFAATG